MTVITLTANIAGIAMAKNGNGERDSGKAERQTEHIQTARAQFRKDIESARESARRQWEQKRESMKEALRDVKEERKRATISRIGQSLNGINARVLAHYAENLEQLDRVLANINIRTNRAEARGFALAPVRTALTLASTSIATARTAVIAQSGKAYGAVISSSTTARADLAAIRDSLKNDLRAVEALVKAARTAVHAAAITLASVRGIGERDEARATSTVPVIILPTLMNIAPATTTAGSGNLTLTINGARFSSSSIVYWSATELPTTFISPTQLTATVSATNVLASGSTAITVRNASSTGGASNAIIFTVVPATTSTATSTI